MEVRTKTESRNQIPSPPLLSSAPEITDQGLLPEGQPAVSELMEQVVPERPGTAPPLEDASETPTRLPREGKRSLPSQTPRALLAVSCRVHVSRLLLVSCTFTGSSQRRAKRVFPKLLSIHCLHRPHFLHACLTCILGKRRNSFCCGILGKDACFKSGRRTEAHTS